MNWADKKVTMKDRLATLSTAPSQVLLPTCLTVLKKAMEFGIPKSTAIFAATRNPAKSIKVYDQVGSLTPGKFADVLIVDDAYNLVKVF